MQRFLALFLLIGLFGLGALPSAGAAPRHAVSGHGKFTLAEPRAPVTFRLAARSRAGRVTGTISATIAVDRAVRTIDVSVSCLVVRRARAALLGEISPPAGDQPGSYLLVVLDDGDRARRSARDRINITEIVANEPPRCDVDDLLDAVVFRPLKKGNVQVG